MFFIVLFVALALCAPPDGVDFSMRSDNNGVRVSFYPTISQKWSLDNNGVRVSFYPTISQKWSQFDAYTIDDCDGKIHWTEDGDTLYHQFLYDDVVTKCGFDQYDKNQMMFTKDFGIVVEDDAMSTKWIFPISFTLFPGVYYASMVDPHNMDIEYGISVSRVKSDWTEWTDTPNECSYNKGDIVYFTVKSLNTDSLKNLSIELRVDVITKGLSVGVITLNVVWSEIHLNFTVPNQDCMRTIDYIYFQFEDSKGLRYYAIYPFRLTVETVKDEGPCNKQLEGGFPHFVVEHFFAVVFWALVIMVIAHYPKEKQKGPLTRSKKNLVK